MISELKKLCINKFYGCKIDGGAVTLISSRLSTCHVSSLYRSFSALNKLIVSTIWNSSKTKRQSTAPGNESKLFSLAFSENRNYFIAITRMMQSGHPQENLMIYGSKLKLYWTA